MTNQYINIAGKIYRACQIRGKWRIAKQDETNQMRWIFLDKEVYETIKEAVLAISKYV